MEFQYPPFADAKREIRLLSLLPGRADDPVKVVVWHTELEPPTDEVDGGRATVAEVRGSLPPGYEVAETQEGRFLFFCELTGKTSWQHPGPLTDQSRLQKAPQLPPPGFEPKYEALSYVWGSADNPRSIQAAMLAPAEPKPEPNGAVDGTAPLIWTQLAVGQNLFEALTHLRLEDARRTLWIDAICINQSDNAEKSEQIMRMADIYKLAWRVLVWLGAESAPDRSQLALSTLAYVGQQIEFTTNGGFCESPGAQESRWCDADAVLPYTADVWAAVAALLARPYFERVWVLQEVIGSNDRAAVLCGRDCTVWRPLMRAIASLSNNSAIPASVRQLAEDRVGLTFRSRVIPVAMLLMMSRMRTCSDPRDKIYGVLGLARPAFRQAIRPDYSQDVVAVYAGAVRAFAEIEASLSLLQQCQVDQHSPGRPGAPARPSWIPAFSQPQNNYLCESYMFASGDSRPVFRFHDDGRTMECMGTRVATVRTVSERLCATVDAHSVFATVRAWAPPELLTAPYVSGGSLLDAFLLLLRFGFVGDRWQWLDVVSLEQWRAYFMEHIYRAEHQPATPIPQETGAGADEHGMTAVLMKNRVFVTTDAGHIGVAPRGTKPGMASRQATSRGFQRRCRETACLHSLRFLQAMLCASS